MGESESLPTRRSLLSRLRNLGDDASWRTFFETYWQLIYNVACKSGLGDPEAQDVVQDTIIAVARKMPGFRYDPEKGSFKQWLLLITRRRIHDHFRRLYRSPAIQARQSDPDSALENLADPAPAPDAQVETAWENEWRQHLLVAALARVRQRVNPKHYQAFDCCVLQNLPAARVARMLGLNMAQVYLAKHRVRLSLKRATSELEAEQSRGAFFCR